MQEANHKTFSSKHWLLFDVGGGKDFSNEEKKCKPPRTSLKHSILSPKHSEEDVKQATMRRKYS
jgi:hypothetical protein